MNYLFVFIILAITIVLIIALKSTSMVSKVKIAVELVEKGDLSDANNIIKKILEKKNDYVPARYIHAQILMKQTQYLLAISELNSILNIPDFTNYIKEVEIHSHLAFCYNATQNWQKELDEYRMILVFDPDHVKGNYRVGHAQYKQQDYRGAKEHLTKVVVLDPQSNECYLPLGVSCFKLSDYKNSEQYLLKSTQANKDPAEAQFYLGLIYKMKNDADNAAEMFERSRTHREYATQSLYNLGIIFFEKGNFKEAITYLEQGLSNLKDNTEESNEYRYLLAECYEKENKIVEAIYNWNKILRDDPEYKNTQSKLDSYKDIINNKKLSMFFSSSLEVLQPVITEFITGLQYKIISKEIISANEYHYKVNNVKGMNDPPVLIVFNRTTKEISEDQIIALYTKINAEKYKSGIYIATSDYSKKAKSAATSKMIELYDSSYVSKIIDKLEIINRLDS